MSGALKYIFGKSYKITNKAKIMILKKYFNFNTPSASINVNI